MKHETTETGALIIRRRGQILVHSYLYYQLDSPLISDDKWQDWSNELVSLQEHIKEVGYEDEQFKDWDGSTGYHLKYSEGIKIVALKLQQTSKAWEKVYKKDVQKGFFQ